jgi:two-component system LytT family response regulator
MLREKLKQFFPDVEIVAECENAEDALTDVLRLRPDLLFLDIQMSGKDGLWLAGELTGMAGETFAPPDVIFTTGYTNSDYLLRAFELAAVDYLVKPVGRESLGKALARYRARSGKSAGLQNLAEAIRKEQLLKIRGFNSLFLFRPDDVAYFEADRDYACAFLANGAREDIFERLGEIEHKLPPETFARVGKSVIVNRKYLRKIMNDALQLVTPGASFRVEISRSAARQLREKL